MNERFANKENDLALILKRKKSEIGERLREFRMRKRLNQSEFAQKIGIEQAALSRIESGNYTLRDDIKEVLFLKFKLDLNWLVTGHGFEGDIDIDKLHKENKLLMNKIVELQSELIEAYRNKGQ
jgi:transcriptional regulator with XRE-family HTH domain